MLNDKTVKGLFGASVLALLYFPRVAERRRRVKEDEFFAELQKAATSPDS